MTMIDRQLSLINWQQQALRNKMKTGITAGGKTTDPSDTKEILELSNALVRAIEALKKHSDLAEELSRRLTGEQLLEAAIKKIEGQSLPTITYAIKRLRAYRESVAPVGGLDRYAIGRDKDDERAVDAIAALVGE